MRNISVSVPHIVCLGEIMQSVQERMGLCMGPVDVRSVIAASVLVSPEEHPNPQAPDNKEDLPMASRRPLGGIGPSLLVFGRDFLPTSFNSMV